MILIDYFSTAWTFIGSLKTPQATVIAAFIAAIISITTIRKSRSTAREKNALDFEMSCQNNDKFQENWLLVQRTIISPMFIDNEINKSKQNDILKPYIDLPKKINQAKKEDQKNKNEGTQDKKNEVTVYDEKTDMIKINSAILFTLNVWERCASAVRNRIYDENFIYSSQASTLIRTYNCLKPYIDSRRKLNSNSRIYVNVEWLATKWELMHTINGDIPDRSRKTVETINVARKRMREHKTLKRCSFKLHLSWLMLKRYKKP